MRTVRCVLCRGASPVFVPVSMATPILAMNKNACHILLFTLSCFPMLQCRKQAEQDRPVTSDEVSSVVVELPAGSRLFFAKAEEQLASGNYPLAAHHLHEGIVAFRFETGRVHGRDALVINHSIDSLTHLRRLLRRNQPVSSTDLHRVVEHALVFVPCNAPHREQ